MNKKSKKSNRADSVLSPEELKKAIEEYKARHPVAPAATDAEEEETAVPAIPVKAQDPEAEDGEDNAVVGVSGQSPEELLQAVKDRRAERDEAGNLEDMESAKGVISHQDEDIETLCNIIDSLLAQLAFDGEDDESSEDKNPVNGAADDFGNADDDESEEGFLNDSGEDEECQNEDDDDDDIPTTDTGDIPAGAVLNADSIDKIVRERVQIGKVASLLNMDGLESIKPMKAKKTIIKAVRPNIRLDGKSAAYIDAMFDLACKEVQKSARKDTMYQRKQMFNKDGKAARRSNASTTDAARERMISRMQNPNKESK